MIQGTVNSFSKSTFPSGHESLIKTAYKMFIDKPIFGHGPKMFRVLCKEEKYNYICSNMFSQFQKMIQGLFFILHAFWIIGSELCIYGVFRDYSVFIERMTYRLASINILYVKVFQAIASNNSLIDEKTNNKLSLGNNMYHLLTTNDVFTSNGEIIPDYNDHIDNLLNNKKII